jgi:hypothetical protein
MNKEVNKALRMARQKAGRDHRSLEKSVKQGGFGYKRNVR